MEPMRHLPCPSNNEDCRYAPNCFESTHHIFPRRTVATRLERRYSEDPRNKVRACRRLHDFLDTLPPPEYPAIERMKRFLGMTAIEEDDE